MATLAHQMNEFDGPHPVRREELAASQRLSLQCFPGFREELTEKDLLASYVPPRRGGVQVLCHRGVPVSQIGIYHSQVNLYGSPLRIASIGGVCTHPDYRGLGLATRLLETCVHKLVAEGARLMLVSGMRNLYARVGCVAAQDFEAIVLKPTFPKGAMQPGQPPPPSFPPPWGGDGGGGAPTLCTLPTPCYRKRAPRWHCRFDQEVRSLGLWTYRAGKWRPLARETRQCYRRWPTSWRWPLKTCA